MASGLKCADMAVIVTGGCKGIGRGCVDVFVANGAKVAVFDIDDNEGSSLKPDGPGEAVFIHCDVRNEEQIKSCIETVVERFGKINCLVNNAGWHPPNKKIDQFTSDDFRSLLELNLIGYFNMCKYALPHLRAVKGNIVNISSGAARYGQGCAVTYCATKGGICSMTKALAIDEMEHGVRVNSISPGPTWTPLMEEWENSMSEEEMKNFDPSKMNLMGRFGKPREIGETCLFLATAATFITGEDLLVAGGTHVF